MRIFIDVLGSRTGSGPALSVLPTREWNERVVSAASTFEGSRRDRYKRFPSTRIQDTCDRVIWADEILRNSDKGVNSEAYVGTGKCELNQAIRLSESLRYAPSLGRVHVEKWASYWEKNGLFASGKSRDSMHSPLQHQKVTMPLARL